MRLQNTRFVSTGIIDTQPDSWDEGRLSDFNLKPLNPKQRTLTPAAALNRGLPRRRYPPDFHSPKGFSQA